MTPDSAVPTDVVKDRLAFVSGSVLGWGIVLAALRPAAAHLDLNASLHFYYDFQDIVVQGRINPEPVLFVLLNVLVSFGATVVLLATVHLVSNGLLLAFSAETRSRAKRLTALSNATFLSALRVTVIVGLFVVLLIPAYPALLLQHWIVSRWAISADLSGAILTLFAMIALAATVWTYMKMGRPGLELLRGKGIVVSALLWFAIYALVSETAFAVELTTSETLYSKASSPYVETTIRLGGATSNPADAVVFVRGQGITRTPPLRGLGNGRFHAILATGSLPPGDYLIELRYSRGSLTQRFPYWHAVLAETLSVAIAP